MVVVSSPSSPSPSYTVFMTPSPSPFLVLFSTPSPLVAINYQYPTWFLVPLKCNRVSQLLPSCRSSQQDVIRRNGSVRAREVHSQFQFPPLCQINSFRVQCSPVDIISVFFGMLLMDASSWVLFKYSRVHLTDFVVSTTGALSKVNNIMLWWSIFSCCPTISQ